MEVVMKNKFKKLILVILSLSLVLSLAACSGGSEEGDLPEEINFGILRVPNDETIALAEGMFQEYFESKGIKVNTTVFDSGVEANQAIASGGIDFATMGNVNAVVALARELDAEMIWIHEVLGEIEGLAVKNGSGIESVQDLAGKKIATPFASTCHYVLLNLLEEEGLQDEVQLLDMKTTEIVAAWERGDIDAAYTWQPSLGEILKTGKVLISSAEMAEKGYITANVDIVRKGFSSQYPDLVVDFIQMLSEAGDIYRNDPDKAAEIVSEELEIPKEEALKQMQGSLWVTAEDLLGDAYFGTSENPGKFAEIMKDTGDFLVEQKSIDTSPTQEKFNEFVNPKYIEMYLERD